MKRMKYAVIVLIMVIAVVNLANADGFKQKPKVIINITLSQAVLNPGLVAAMHAQLTPGFLVIPQPVYVAEVLYNGAVYRIMGSRQLWLSFFQTKWELMVPPGGKMARPD